MRLNWMTKGSDWRICARLLVGAAIVISGMTEGVRAQEAEEQKPCPVKAPQPPESTLTVYLTNMTQVNEANDLQTAVRNMVKPGTHVYYEQTANAILLRGTADELALAQKLITDLDRPKKVYRLVYSVELMDGSKPVSAQHYALVAVLGERATLKLGNRVPVVTGKTDADSGTASSQVQYMDVGLGISATLSGSGDGLMLRTKVEQTTVADEKSGVGSQDPMLHQAILDNASRMTIGKALTLGSLDIPGGTERIEVEVVSEMVK
jgi:type II secretory pathway component GspD/PulD (secretin)